MIKFFKVRLERFFVTSEEECVKLGCEQIQSSLGHINLSWTEGKQSFNNSCQFVNMLNQAENMSSQNKNMANKAENEDNQ